MPLRANLGAQGMHMPTNSPRLKANVQWFDRKIEKALAML